MLSWQFIEPNAYNFMVKHFSAAKNGSDNIVVIVIDDKSIAYRRWPWPREYYAKIMEFLNDYAKPEIIGYDAILTSLDKENPQSDEYFFNTVKRIDNLVTGFSPLQQPYENIEAGRKYDIKFKTHQSIKGFLYGTWSQ